MMTMTTNDDIQLMINGDVTIIDIQLMINDDDISIDVTSEEREDNTVGVKKTKNLL